LVLGAGDEICNLNSAFICAEGENIVKFGVSFKYSNGDLKYFSRHWCNSLHHLSTYEVEHILYLIHFIDSILQLDSLRLT
jgi:hypothetical protein